MNKIDSSPIKKSNQRQIQKNYYLREHRIARQFKNEFKRNPIKIRRTSNWNRIPKHFISDLIVVLFFRSGARYRIYNACDQQSSWKVDWMNKYTGMFALNQLLRNAEIFFADICVLYKWFCVVANEKSMHKRQWRDKFRILFRWIIFFSWLISTSNYATLVIHVYAVAENSQPLA